MKCSGIKSHKNEGFSLFPENTFLENPQELCQFDDFAILILVS